MAATLAPGAPADLVLWSAPDETHLAYRLATPLVAGVWKSGVRVV